MGRNRSRRKIRSSVPEQLTDITLADCANNPQRLWRPKVRRDLVNKENVDEDSGSSDETAAIEIVLQSEKPTKKAISFPAPSLVECPGRTYPSDLWFLIVRYISVEDLVNFALLCRGAYEATQSTELWRRLYKRFYVDVASLPVDLQVYCVDRPGLQARAVRLLHLRCPAMIQRRRQPDVSARYEPRSLHGSRLVLAWHEKEGDQWSCYFKFAAAGGADEERPTGAEPELTHNPQRGFRVLKTTSDQRLCFPYPSYAYVSVIQLGLASDLRRQKLTLGFGDYATTRCAAKMKQSLGRSAHVKHQIELEPLSKCLVLCWWHPEYPHPRPARSAAASAAAGLDCSSDVW